MHRDWIFRPGLVAILLALVGPVAMAQSMDCWSGSFRTVEEFWGTYTYRGTMTVAFDSQQWRTLLTAEAGTYVIGTATLTESCSGTRKVQDNEPQECNLSIDNQSGAAELMLQPGDNRVVLTVSGDPSFDIRSGYGVIGSASWLHVSLSDSEIESNQSYNGELGAGELHLTRSNCTAGNAANLGEGPSDVPPRQNDPGPDAGKEQSAAKERAADALLSGADELLAQLKAQPSKQPNTQRPRISYVAFAIHNGLHPDGSWAVSPFMSTQNAADGAALSSCNAQVPIDAGRCNSDGDCRLATGQWAAYAVATRPFMSSDGKYVSATSCSMPTETAAEANALQACQANDGGTMQCKIVWSGTGQ